MIYQILKKTKYKGCPIYIRRLDKVFEFLVIYKNELYSQYVLLVPGLFKMFYENPFSEKEVRNTTLILIGQAQDLINKLKEK